MKSGYAYRNFQTSEPVPYTSMVKIQVDTDTVSIENATIVRPLK